MKLPWIHFDWLPVIPGGKRTGGESVTDLRDCSYFNADDGWSLTKLPGGEVEIDAPWLVAPVIVDRDRTYPGVRAVVEPEPAPKAKKR